MTALLPAHMKPVRASTSLSGLHLAAPDVELLANGLAIVVDDGAAGRHDDGAVCWFAVSGGLLLVLVMMGSCLSFSWPHLGGAYEETAPEQNWCATA